MSAVTLTETPLPNAKDVRDLLEGLLGRDVDVTTGGAMVDPGAAAARWSASTSTRT